MGGVLMEICVKEGDFWFMSMRMGSVVCPSMLVRMLLVLGLVMNMMELGFESGMKFYSGGG